jgi:3-dehydroquinate synthetase
MIAALRVGLALGVTRAEDATRLETLLARLGLPTALDREPLGEALALVALDKKRLGGRVRFVLLRRLGHPEVHATALTDLAALLAPGR